MLFLGFPPTWVHTEHWIAFPVLQSSVLKRLFYTLQCTCRSQSPSSFHFHLPFVIEKFVIYIWLSIPFFLISHKYTIFISLWVHLYPSLGPSTSIQMTRFISFYAWIISNYIHGATSLSVTLLRIFGLVPCPGTCK